MSWQAIADARVNEVMFVCDERDGKPYTVAKAFKSFAGIWMYPGTVEEIDFEPAFRADYEEPGNPFHWPLPSPSEVSLGAAGLLRLRAEAAEFVQIGGQDAPQHG